MKIEEAIQRLERSAGIPERNTSVRIKQKFSNILHEVKYKELSPDQLLRIEEELEQIFDGLDLGTENADRQLKMRLRRLLKYLRINFSLVPEGYCATYGLKLGLSGGLLIMLILLIYTSSTLTFYTPLGGLITGFIVGSLCDRRQKNKGKSLLTRMV
ncbi:hypothetical protein [Salinimicrobium xinjiangense]|uniref:hypothetical protein n=1 Tax=Salinimicrobium xinjiangense TaxID=438596 RepID=UPI00041EE5C0|nr:hypothetical protein [Salinimicrobium xinjiangense]